MLLLYENLLRLNKVLVVPWKKHKIQNKMVFTMINSWFLCHQYWKTNNLHPVVNEEIYLKTRL